MVDLVDPSVSYTNAFNAAQNVTNTFRKNMAFKALEKTYGPIVGDMKLATDVQAYEHNQLLNPLKIDSQQLANEALMQSNAFNKANNPLVLEGNRIDNAQGQFDLTQDQDKAARDEQLRQAQEIHTTLTGVLSAVESELDGIIDPNERLAVFDRNVEQIAPMIGADPDELLHSLAQQRAAVAAQGVGAIQPIRQQLDDLMYGGMSPEDRADLELKRAQIITEGAQAEKALADAEASRVKADAAKVEEANKVKVAARTLDDFKLKKQVADDAIDRAIAIAEKYPMATGPSSIPEANGVKLAPGAANLAAELNTLQSHIGLDELRKLKDAGATLGQVTMGEHTLLQGALGAVAQGQNQREFVANLRRIKKILDDTTKRTEEAFKEDFGDVETDDDGSPVVDAADYFKD